jgi:beta-lactamase regulating signal transducer with metallopeptidase domain
MSAAFFTGCERILSATANGIYQGILVTALAGLILKLFVRTNAATRHAIWFRVLLLVTALIPAHLLLCCRLHPESPTNPARPVSMVAVPAPSYSGYADAPLVVDAALPDPQPDEPFGDSRIDALATGQQSPLAGAEIGSEDQSKPAAPEKTWARFIPVSLKPSSWNLERAIRLPHWMCLCLIAAWALLASVRGGLIARRLAEVRRVKNASSLPSHGLQMLFNRLRDSLVARRSVQLRISSKPRTAAVLGFVHPVVLLPAEMDKEANEHELEHVLRHELAHVDRRDDWGNLAQQLIQAALFFHPAVWWISAKLSLEREIACDDHVLEASGQPRAYALTLANVASRMSHRQALLAPGVSNNHSQLQERITMILNTQRDRSPRLVRSRLGFFTTATAILAVLAITAGPRLVLAQPPEAAPPPPEPAEIAPPPPPGAAIALVAPVALPPDEAGPESGPRIKADDNDNNNNNDNDDNSPPAPPSASVAPVSALPPVPALVAIAPESPAAPMAQATPASRHLNRNMSVEERLDRLERIIEDLDARGGAKIRRHGDGHGDSVVVDGKNWAGAPGPMAMDLNLDLQLKRAAEQAKRAADQARRELESSQRDAEASKRDAEAGQRDAEQALRDMAKLKSKDFERMQKEFREAQSEGPRRELEALRAARESLQGQLQKLERQINRLEEDQNRQKEDSHGGSGSNDEGPKHKEPAPEKTF